MSDTDTPFLWLNRTSSVDRESVQIMLGNDCVAWTDERGAALLEASGKLDIVFSDTIVLDVDAFDALEKLLDAPPQDCPELAALFASPTVFDQDA